MPRLLLVRHAQSTWNVEGRWQGWADPPLSSFGRRQAAAAATRLPWTPARWVASDLVRARQTAGLLAGHPGDPSDGVAEGDPADGVAKADTAAAVATDAGLREYDAGEWTGMRRAEIEAQWPDLLAAWDAGDAPAPGGEEPAAFAERLVHAVTSVGRGYGDAVVVSHGRAIHTIGSVLGWPAFYVGHLAGIEIDADHDGGLVPRAPVALLPPDLVAPRLAGPAAL